jgi:hypothetical protein
MEAVKRTAPFARVRIDTHLMVLPRIIGGGSPNAHRRHALFYKCLTIPFAFLYGSHFSLYWFLISGGFVS